MTREEWYSRVVALVSFYLDLEKAESKVWDSVEYSSDFRAGLEVGREVLQSIRTSVRSVLSNLLLEGPPK